MKSWFSEKKDMELEIERLKNSEINLIERIRELEDKLDKVKKVIKDEFDPYDE